MIYSLRRFSGVSEALQSRNEYLSSQVDSGLIRVEDLSTRIIEDPRLKDLRPVKRHGRLVRSMAQLLRRGKPKKEKKYSETPKDPTTTINTSEANKFKVAMTRLTNSMGSSDSQGLV